VIWMNANVCRCLSARVFGLRHKAHRAPLRVTDRAFRWGQARLPPTRAGAFADSAVSFVAAGAAAGGIPHLPADVVEGLGGPGDEVERVQVVHRLRYSFSNDGGDPVGGVGRDMRQPLARAPDPSV
jgi:hypothetical protein